MGRSASLGRNRLRVGVLPFLASSAANDEDLASSVSQEIATALTRCQGFDVIAPASLMQKFTPIRTSSGANQIQDLDYVVDGAVSRDGKRLQVSVRLLDISQYARTVWNERSVLAIGKLREWSELAATRIVNGIDPVIFFLDGQPRRRKRGGASGLLLLAMPLMYSMERRKYEEAGQLIDQALEMEPDNAMAAAWAAFWQVVYFGQGWTQDLTRASAIAQEHARRAVGLNPDGAETLSICGHACSFLNRDYDTALYYFDRAQRLNPGLEFAWLWSAATYSYVGKPGAALERLKRYHDLTPIDPCYVWSQNIHAIAYTFAGAYEKALVFSRRATQLNPGFVNGYKPLIASLGHLGRREEAQPYVAKLLALEPNFTVERFGQVYPIKYEGDRAHYMAGLRLAGVPER
jgi:TolB-like protein/predicted Zn-dependent protease